MTIRHLFLSSCLLTFSLSLQAVAVFAVRRWLWSKCWCSLLTVEVFFDALGLPLKSCTVIFPSVILCISWKPSPPQPPSMNQEPHFRNRSVIFFFFLTTRQWNCSTGSAGRSSTAAGDLFIWWSDGAEQHCRCFDAGSAADHRSSYQVTVHQIMIMHVSVLLVRTGLQRKQWERVWFGLVWFGLAWITHHLFYRSSSLQFSLIHLLTVYVTLEAAH